MDDTQRPGPDSVLGVPTDKQLGTSPPPVSLHSNTSTSDISADLSTDVSSKSRSTSPSSRGSSPGHTQQATKQTETSHSIPYGAHRTHAEGNEPVPVLPPTCPAATSEFKNILEDHPLLRPTGCTDQFCQSGRMNKTSEPRVGQDKLISEVQSEGVDFLRQLQRDRILKSDDEICSRMKDVLYEIQANAVSQTTSAPSRGRSGTGTGTLGGGWHQTFEELQHGLRLAWKNSSKCIMRSEYSTLELCDLRHITSSQEMGAALVKHLGEAFNYGNISPTVFVFPPRKPGQRGPMIWNSQLLSFAAYQTEDGVLGDPANAQLTKDIIELGWQPPVVRTQWDLLPIVTMAEGDGPIITDIPKEQFPLVMIKHPNYQLQFEKLGLRWVPAPALSRLGFDIGGVQYTATPFLGWFMDAEAGVRDLADKQRYNVLPRLATAMGWTESKHDLGRLPEHEKMAILSRAQTELNYAVYHSYREAGVKMTDTLSASSMYCSFDDEHWKSKGYRLPSNPYYLAPPQGSIVPIWHRGGAPNYQPLPLICKHVQDPVRAWKREIQKISPSCSLLVRLSEEHLPDENENLNGDAPARRKIHIAFCSAATSARKLAENLHHRLETASSNTGDCEFHIVDVRPLNDLSVEQIKSREKLLVVASTAGRGEMPANGKRFSDRLKAHGQRLDFEFAVFGNGSSTYNDTFNASAQRLHDMLQERGATPLEESLYKGDSALEDPAWQQFDQWYNRIQQGLGLLDEAETGATNLSETIIRGSPNVTETLKPAKLVSSKCQSKNGMHHVALDIGNADCGALSNLSVIIPNHRKSVKLALNALGLFGRETLERYGNMTVNEYLTEFVNLEAPFLSLDWADSMQWSRSKRDVLQTLPLQQALRSCSSAFYTAVPPIKLDDVFAAMPSKHLRTFSVASSPQLTRNRGRNRHVELLIQPRPNGVASGFFQKAPRGSRLLVRPTSTKVEHVLADSGRRIICFAIGSGLAPVRSLLQHRLTQRMERPERTMQPVSLILGFREQDTSLVAECLRELCATAGIVDMQLLTPSNPSKARAQDRVFDDGVRERLESKLKHEDAAVFVCASATAADDFAVNLSAILGADVQTTLGERYVQEVYKPSC